MGVGEGKISQTFALFVSDFSRVKINRAPFPSDYEAELTKDFHLPEPFTSSLKFQTNVGEEDKTIMRLIRLICLV